MILTAARFLGPMGRPRWRSSIWDDPVRSISFGGTLNHVNSSARRRPAVEAVENAPRTPRFPRATTATTAGPHQGSGGNREADEYSNQVSTKPGEEHRGRGCTCPIPHMPGTRLLSLVSTARGGRHGLLSHRTYSTNRSPHRTGTVHSASLACRRMARPRPPVRGMLSSLHRRLPTGVYVSVPIVTTESLGGAHGGSTLPIFAFARLVAGGAHQPFPRHAGPVPGAEVCEACQPVDLGALHPSDQEMRDRLRGLGC